jgi:hypothetical protein
LQELHQWRPHSNLRRDIPGLFSRSDLVRTLPLPECSPDFFPSA